MFHTMLFLLEYPPAGYDGNPCCADCWWKIAEATTSDISSRSDFDQISVGAEQQQQQQQLSGGGGGGGGDDDDACCPFDWVSQCHRPVMSYANRTAVIKLLQARDVAGLTAAIKICECRVAWKAFWHRKSDAEEEDTTTSKELAA